jgi:DnaJ-class molecular chaperone
MAIICHECKGNGYHKLRFEGEEAIEQCKICHSQGQLIENKHYHQTWSDGVSDEITSFYWGPPLDPESFKNYKIYPE